MKNSRIKLVVGRPTWMEARKQRKNRSTTLYLFGAYPSAVLDELALVADTIEVREFSVLACKLLVNVADDLIVYKNEKVRKQTKEVLDGMRFQKKQGRLDCKFGNLSPTTTRPELYIGDSPWGQN